MTSKLTREQTQQIIDAADAVISALAGTNDEVHKDDTDKMIRLWDDLNDRYAPPEVVRELARIALAAIDSEPVELPLDYLQGHKDGLEWAAQLAKANHPETGDLLYDDPIELAKAISKGPDMPSSQPVADSEPVAWIVHARTGDQLTTDGGYVANAEGILGLHSTPLYRHAQPVPVAQCVPLGDSPYDVPHSMPSNLRELIAEEIGILFSDDDAQSVWDVCRRAAMLQAEPVTTANKLGNSPVIPDGYVMVPKEPTAEMIAAAMNCDDVEFNSDETFCVNFDNIYAAMVEAAPQEVKGE